MSSENATEEIPETFEVFAILADGSEISIDEINAEFNWNFNSIYTRYLYKDIRINGIKFRAYNNRFLRTSSNIDEYILSVLSESSRDDITSDIYIDFIDFYKGISTIIYSIGDENITITFSDLYEECEEVVQ